MISTISSPYDVSFFSPTPDTPRNWSSDVGLTLAISRKVASWNTTYAGTPCARAVSTRHQRSLSKIACSDFDNSISS